MLKSPKPYVCVLGEMTIANRGSLGLSYDGDSRASYLLLDDGRATIHRVEYDIDKKLAGLIAARARGRHGGRPDKMTPAKLRLMMAATDKPETEVAKLCEELGTTRQTLYHHVSPHSELRADGRKLLERTGRRRSI